MVRTTKSPATRPRPQQARSLATRIRLLDATIEVLVETGYGSLTTTTVASRANVSQGALYKHFATKTHLLAAAIEHLFRHLIDDYVVELERAVAANADRVGTAISLLWKMFTAPRLQAAFELYLAARTDAALGDALEPVLAEHRAHIARTARRLFPEAAASHPDFDGVVSGLITTMQGGAIMSHVLPAHDLARQELAFIERIARRELESVLSVAPEDDA